MVLSCLSALVNFRTSVAKGVDSLLAESGTLKIRIFLK